MQILRNPIRELGGYDEMSTALRKGQRVLVTGCVDAQKLHIADGLGAGYEQRIIATFSEQKARELYEDALLYDRETLYYPAKDLIFYQADIHSNNLVMDRIRVIRRLLEGKPCTVITTFDALMQFQVPVQVYLNHITGARVGRALNLKDFSRNLAAMGYEKAYQVEAPGQFAVRGDIIDVFDLTEENPYRIELWGDDVESIRKFDIESQRSIEAMSSVTIFPATEMVLDEDRIQEGLNRILADGKKISDALRKEFHTEEAHRISQQMEMLRDQVIELQSYMNLDSYIRYFYPEAGTFLSLFDKEKCIVILDEPLRVKEHANAVEQEFRESMKARVEKGYLIPGQMEILRSAGETFGELERSCVLALAALESSGLPIHFEVTRSVQVKSVAPYNNSFETLTKDLATYKKNGYRILLISGSRTRAERLAKDLTDEELIAFYSEDRDHVLLPGEIMTFYGHLSKGFEYPMLKLVVISDTDIFGAVRKKRKKYQEHKGTKLKDFSQLKIGDYVVHENHGLGVYKGIEKVEVEKTVRDYMRIEYRDSGVLYVPATGLDVLQKYSSADAEKAPKISKLGTQEWTKTKSKVRQAVNEIADDLVRLYASRREATGFCFSKDNVWQREFEEMFPFEETEDQLTAIEATKADMESTKIMDRLICGDVGFGKTEIAIRAAFKAVQDGKQVAFLVPTTILAQQHYNTFLQRMKDYPVSVELLCRFRSPSQQKESIERLRKGMSDIVIGTHRLLSADVQFKDLGLLVIDEEQRFGVSHKEKIKKLRENIDVLTLTATPIPRTLHMSLAGIRDMSVLEEAPDERQPIQTYVMEYNEEMVREAIVRELSRGGQVYYVFNRVAGIGECAAAIQNMVPEANVAYAHGQMKESELEHIMYDFINGEIDVLVSTTIIETGLDISNVNTIIIHDSDQMGLSQLYQLRGRVGRSNRTSYAFLMYKRDKMLREIAEKRLAAIREFTDLGSGFKIAMRDLEIRGAGNILGTSQHGHMAAVGYDLYCKMLNEAVRVRKGIPATMDYQTLVDLNINAFIPADYILNEEQKLEIYKRIAMLESEDECNEMRGELLDRFGKVPRSADNLIRISYLRMKAHERFLTEIKGSTSSIRMKMLPTAPVQVDVLPKLMSVYSGKLTMTMQKEPIFVLKLAPTGHTEKDEDQALDTLLQLMKDMQLLFESTGENL